MDLIADCRDKIEILAAQGSDAYAQEVCNLLADSDHELIVLALLVCFDKRTTAMLTAAINAKQAEALIVLASKTGNLQRARGLRKRALVEFYHAIAVYEFADSPLVLQLPQHERITSLMGEQLKDVVLDIAPEHLTAMLSCLSPLRVAKIIKRCQNDRDKQTLIAALESVCLVSNRDVENLIHYLTVEQFPRRQKVSKAQYLAKILNNLDRQESDQLLLALRTDPVVMKELDNYIFPFAQITALQASQIAEIFADCPDKRIAETIFTADTITQNSVLESLPEPQRLGVRKELTLLTDDDEEMIKRSTLLQNSICKYLQSMVALRP
ncbi:MAG: hypothetical protein OYH77_03250 [Pseudomonadota bacterium]|nr:hypothetical protein [Pseudomonadota bacterium]